MVPKKEPHHAVALGGRQTEKQFPFVPSIPRFFDFFTPLKKKRFL